MIQGNLLVSPKIINEAPMRRISLLFFCLFISLFLTSNCANRQADVQGSVFIVTKGADNYKLGLVKITAIPESDITSFVENKKSLIVTETGKLTTDIDNIRSQTEVSQSKYDNLKKEYESLNNQKKELEAQQASLSSEFSSYMLTSCYSDYATIDMVEECRKQVRIGKQLDTLSKRLAGFALKVSKAHSAMSESENALNSSKARIGEILEKVKNYLTPDYLLDGLPEGNIKTVTDAEGKFAIKLPRGKYVIVASAQRRVFSTTEDYHWLISVDASGSETKQITLSNTNMLGEDTEDSVFRFKELVPALENPKPNTNGVNVKV